jgi:hypothetical protein
VPPLLRSVPRPRIFTHSAQAIAQPTKATIRGLGRVGAGDVSLVRFSDVWTGQETFPICQVIHSTGSCRRMIPK